MNPYESPEHIPDEYPGKTLSDVLLTFGVNTFWAIVFLVAAVFIAIIHMYVIVYLGLIGLSNRVGHRLFPQYIRYETWKTMEQDTPKLVLFSSIAWFSVLVEWVLLLLWRWSTLV